MKKTIIFIFLFLISGCSTIVNNPDYNFQISSFCNGLMSNEECSQELEAPYSSLLLEQKLLNNVFLSNNNKLLTFFIKKNCCTNIVLSSIKQDNTKTEIRLTESADGCSCGFELQKIEINFAESIDKNNLEIYHKNHLKKTEMIYPFKN